MAQQACVRGNLLLNWIGDDLLDRRGLRYGIDLTHEKLSSLADRA